MSELDDFMAQVDGEKRRKQEIKEIRKQEIREALEDANDMIEKLAITDSMMKAVLISLAFTELIKPIIAPFSLTSRIAMHDPSKDQTIEKKKSAGE